MLNASRLVLHFSAVTSAKYHFAQRPRKSFIEVRCCTAVRNRLHSGGLDLEGSATFVNLVRFLVDLSVNSVSESKNK